jgi:hypothetical protein
MAAQIRTDFNVLSLRLDDLLSRKESEVYSSTPRNDVGKRLALSSFFKELRSAKDKLVKKYAAQNERERLHCVMEIAGLKSLVVKEVLYWNKTILRRMRKTPRQGSPYRIHISHRLSSEIFEYVKDLLECVNAYGVEVITTKNITTLNISYERKLELFLKDILGEAFDGIPQKVIDNCTVKLLVTMEKLFTIKYSKSTEKLDIHCFYGLWNQFNVPQHL